MKEDQIRDFGKLHFICMCKSSLIKGIMMPDLLWKHKVIEK